MAAPRRPLHRLAHPECPQGATTWDACEKAVLEARGRCVALTEKETECTNWAVAEFEDRAYCGQHYGSRVNAALASTRAAVRKAELDTRIDLYIAWSALHPSTWDRMPDGWQPPTANTGPVSPWRASSGLPFTRGGAARASG